MTTKRPRTIPHDRALRILNRLSACKEAAEWLGDKSRTGAQAWRACPHGDWLLWAAEKVGVNKKALSRAHAAYCRAPYNSKAETDAIRKHIPWRVVAAAMARNNGRFA